MGMEMIKLEIEVQEVVARVFARWASIRRTCDNAENAIAAEDFDDDRSQQACSELREIKPVLESIQFAIRDAMRRRG